MSRFEYVFFDSDLSPDDAATVLADRLGLELIPRRAPCVPEPLVGRPSITESGGRIGGPISYNHLSWPEEPEERAPFDGCRLVWKLWATDPGEDYEYQRMQADELFNLLVGRLGWPAVLLDGLSFVRASFDPVRGLRRFPPGTLAEAQDEHVWA